MQEKKQIFEVDKSYEWTPELITQLPHGTRLRCAYFPEDEFLYTGQRIEKEETGDFYIYNNLEVCYFTCKATKRYAKILSLPESYLIESKAFKWIAPELIKAGDLKLKLGGLGMPPKVDCRVISEDNYQFLLSFAPEEIRNPDPYKKYREAIDEIIKMYIGHSLGIYSKAQLISIELMLIEIAKRFDKEGGDK